MNNRLFIFDLVCKNLGLRLLLFDMFTKHMIYCMDEVRCSPRAGLEIALPVEL